MPKRGKKNAQETEREKSKKFVALRRQHSAVESQINALEHHGLDRCLDVGMEGYLRYVGYGVLAYNSIRSGKNSSKVGAVSRRRLKKHPRPKKRGEPGAVCLEGLEFFGKPGKKEKTISFINK